MSFQDIVKRIKQGGDKKNHEKNSAQKKLFARKRIELLCDKDSFIEDGFFANCANEELSADGVITGVGKINGRNVAVMANDSTIKAGSWGPKTVEKILRLQELAQKNQVPVFYLVDSAGARITDQVQMFPGRRGAGKIFFNESRNSGVLPQICLLFGPSAAGGAYIPAFCELVIMVKGNASMYLGSPRMAESVIGEKVTLEEMGGAEMHCSTSGCGDILVESEEEAISTAKKYFSYIPQNYLQKTSKVKPTEAISSDLKSIIPEQPQRAYDMRKVIDTLIDQNSFFEMKPLYAKELITGFARLNGEVIGIIANQPLHKGGVLFYESANKAARFIQICDSYNIPLLFLSDVPGFMIGSKVEKEGIIRAGAKMILAVSNARVPKICLIIRKAYGAGLYAMSGPAYGSDCVLALPSAQIAVMGPEPATYAVYYNKMVEMKPDEKKQFLAEKVSEYQKDVDIYRLASEMVVDHMIDFDAARTELIKRFEFYNSKPISLEDKNRPMPIVPM